MEHLKEQIYKEFRQHGDEYSCFTINGKTEKELRSYLQDKIYNFDIVDVIPLMIANVLSAKLIIMSVNVDTLSAHIVEGCSVSRTFVLLKTERKSF